MNLGSRGRWVSEFKVSLFYIISSKASRATKSQKSKQKTNKTNNKIKPNLGWGRGLGGWGWGGGGLLRTLPGQLGKRFGKRRPKGRGRRTSFSQPLPQEPAQGKSQSLKHLQATLLPSLFIAEFEFGRSWGSKACWGAGLGWPPPHFLRPNPPGGPASGWLHSSPWQL